MENNLNIAIVPLDTAWGDRDENLYKAAESVGKLAPDTDIAVLPEMFSTGFVTDNVLMASLADSSRHHPTLDALADMARRGNLAVCASFLFSPDAATYFNRCVLVEPSGETTFYDKRHLFSLGNESQALTAGTALPPVVRFRGWNVAMAVCYDLRFPAWLRNTGNKYDVLLLPANWPDVRSHAWNTLLAARAIENQAYVVGANRSGIDDFGTYNGLSNVFDPLGLPIAKSTSTGAILTATLVRKHLTDIRKRMLFAADADSFIIS